MSRAGRCQDQQDFFFECFKNRNSEFLSVLQTFLSGCNTSSSTSRSVVTGRTQGKGFVSKLKQSKGLRMYMVEVIDEKFGDETTNVWAMTNDMEWRWSQDYTGE